MAVNPDGAETPPPSEPRLYVPLGHYYSPVPPESEVTRHLSRLDPDPDSLTGIAIDPEAMTELWHRLAPAMRSAPFGFESRDGLRYRFDNGAFSWGDGLALHAMLLHLRPRRIIEIGSGWSSACMVDTIDRHLADVQTRLTCVEPYPELLRETLGPRLESIELLDIPVQELPFDRLNELQRDDVLFIDSTHVLRTGSDVHYELTEILPRLNDGVVVHFHDMFWPFEYPAMWSVVEARAWNEIYAIRAFLCENPRWQIMFFNDYFARKRRSLVEHTCPAFLRNAGGGLWLRRVAA